LKGIDTTLKVSGILFVLVLFTAATSSGFISVYADTSNPLTNKEEFDVVVSGISHKSILVSVSIDGLTQKFTIHRNPNYISAPTVQTIVFKFARNLGATPPTALPIKIGDIWTACVSLVKDTQSSSCSSLPVTSLTQPQRQLLDARYIPGQKSGVRPATLAPLG
jgi:hypothetical protein